MVNDALAEFLQSLSDGLPRLPMPGQTGPGESRPLPPGEVEQAIRDAGGLDAPEPEPPQGYAQAAYEAVQDTRKLIGKLVYGIQQATISGKVALMKEDEADSQAETFGGLPISALMPPTEPDSEPYYKQFELLPGPDSYTAVCIDGATVPGTPLTHTTGDYGICWIDVIDGNTGNPVIPGPSRLADGTYKNCWAVPNLPGWTYGSPPAAKSPYELYAFQATNYTVPGNKQITVRKIDSNDNAYISESAPHVLYVAEATAYTLGERKATGLVAYDSGWNSAAQEYSIAGYDRTGPGGTVYPDPMAGEITTHVQWTAIGFVEVGRTRFATELQEADVTMDGLVMVNRTTKKLGVKLFIPGTGAIGSALFTGDLNDSSSVKLADVVDGLITQTYY